MSFFPPLFRRCSMVHGNVLLQLCSAFPSSLDTFLRLPMLFGGGLFYWKLQQRKEGENSTTLHHKELFCLTSSAAHYIDNQLIQIRRIISRLVPMKAGKMSELVKDFKLKPSISSSHLIRHANTHHGTNPRKLTYHLSACLSVLKRRSNDVSAVYILTSQHPKAPSLAFCSSYTPLSGEFFQFVSSQTRGKFHIKEIFWHHEVPHMKR